MKKLETNKGITLIALIITIIVMLILVGVTVSVALNGGLFTTAKEAANKTQIETDRETLASAAWGTIGNNGEVDFTELDKNLPEGFEGSNGTYTKGEKTFKVDQYGNVIIKIPSTGDLALLEEYCLGKNFTDIFDGNDIPKFKNNDVIANAEENLIFLNLFQDSTHGFGYAKYNGRAYKISVEIKTNICDAVELVYEQKGREGQTIKYDADGTGEKDWTIIYDNGDSVEIVSPETMGSLVLGYNDTEAQAPGDVDKDGTENTSIDKAIYSYNNAVARINNYCDSLVMNENEISVRSVGSDPNNSFSENSTLYTSENLANWADGKYNGVGKSEDTNLEQDLVRMSYHGCITTEKSYWMASRAVPESSSTNVYLGVYYVDLAGYCSSGNLWSVGSDVSAYGYQQTYGVRPVVKLSNI